MRNKRRKLWSNRIKDFTMGKIKILSLSLLMFLNYSCFKNIDSNKKISVSGEEVIDKYIENKRFSENHVTIKDLIGLLGNPIDSMPDVMNYSKEKVIIEDEEGESKWFGIKYFDKKELILIAESNWVNINMIDRITLYTKKIREDKLYVGQSIGNIRELLADRVPSSPDGELYVKYKIYTEIIIQLDISEFSSSSPLYYGVTNLSEIPNDLEIESIIIMNE